MIPHGLEGPGITIPYSQFGDDRTRPYVTIIVEGHDGSDKLIGLVDSGADVSVFPYASAADLGFESTDLLPYWAAQVSGRVALWQAARPISCTLRGDAHEHLRFELRPTFVDGADIVLLGRRDFMAAWTVMISEPSQSLTLWWNRSTSADLPGDAAR